MQQRKPKLLILLDWRPNEDWVFRHELECVFAADICFGDAPKSFQSTFEKVYFLWKSYVAVATRAFFKANTYDMVYAWHAVIGLVFAFLCRFFRKDKPKIVVAQLIVPRKSNSFAQRMKSAFTRYALKRVDCVIVYSHIEVEQFKQDYSNGRTEFAFIPLGVAAPEKLPQKDSDYIFAGGRSNRDYATFIDAIRGTSYKVHIAAQRFNLNGALVPENVHAHFNAFGDEFSDLLAGASLVVIPLDRPDESSGQLVLLQAMSMGKAIIVTQSRGISDYYIEEKTAAIVPAHDAKALRQKIDQLMKSPTLREEMGAAAQKLAQEFTPQKHAEHIAQLLSRIIYYSKH